MWYFYFTVELLWFVMVNLLLADRSACLMAYFSFVVFNALIGLMLLCCLALGSGFFLVFIGKFGLLPLLSVVFNYLSYVSMPFLVNYVLLKLGYFLIYLSAAHSHTHVQNSELLLCLASLAALFVLSVSHNLVSFNLYSIVSSTFTYLLLLILYIASSNSLFALVYIVLYSYCSIVLYYVFSIALKQPSHTHASAWSPPASNVSLSFQLLDLNSIAAFMYPLYSSFLVYMLVVAGVVPLFVFFLKVFYVCLASASLPLVFVLSFGVFFMFSYAFLNLLLHCC